VLTDAKQESILTNRTKETSLDYPYSMTDTEEILLFHDGSSRCSKCINIVQQLGDGQNPFLKLDDEEEEFPLQKKHRRRRYEPNYPCMTCQGLLGSKEYHRLSDHLLDAHESAGKEHQEIMIPREGCCFLCLLVLQFKCRNDFPPRMRTPPENNGKLTYTGIGFARLGQLQFFSDTINEPVIINRYLPQG